MKLKLLYGFVPFGALSGFPALFIRSDTKESLPFNDAIATILDAFQSMNIKKGSHILCFDTRYGLPAEEDVGEMTKLLDWALNRGIFVLHYLNGSSRPPYVRMGGIIKTYIKDDDWLKFDTHELYWSPQSKEDSEPSIERTKSAFLLLNKKINLRWAMDFILDCEGPWAVALPPKDSVEVILYG